MQAFVQKLAVCLLDVDRNPDSPMFEQLNNWTAEATCFVSLFCIAVTFFAYAQSHCQPMATVIGPAKVTVTLFGVWQVKTCDLNSCTLGICFAREQLDIIADPHVLTVHSVHVLTQTVEHAPYKLR